MITEVSNIMFEQFVNNFKKQLQSPDATGTEATTAAAKPISGVGVAFSALKAAVSRHSEAIEAKPDPAKAPTIPAQSNALSYTSHKARLFVIPRNWRADLNSLVTSLILRWLQQFIWP